MGGELLFVQHHQSTSSPADCLMLSRRGLKFTRDHLGRIRLESILPRVLLDERIRKTCLEIFNTGHYQAAVFEAFKELEIAIRKAAGFPEEAHGMPMVTDAFHAEKGPLRNQNDPAGERQALQLLMAGAVGVFKNPRSHRNVELSDPKEAAEMLIVASHLLRIVDSRRHTPAST